MGTRTQEYQVFQANFDRLVNAVSSDVETVASKLFAKKLISSSNMTAAQNKYHSPQGRTSSLMSQILGKIEEKKDNFHVFMSILQSIPTLCSIGNDISGKAGGIQVPISTPPIAASVSSTSNVAIVPRGSGGSQTTVEPQTGTTASGTASEPRDPPPPLTVREAFRMTVSMASEWQNIGTLLEPSIDEGTLATIRANNPQNVNTCLREMLIKWLKQVDPHPSWAALADAIEPFNPKKAWEIRDKCV